MIKRYKYKVKKDSSKIRIIKPKVVAKEPEQLTGLVRGENASDLEERFAKALDKRNIDYYFRLPIGGNRGDPGWKELDFLVVSGGYYPVEIENITFIHLGKTAEDTLKDAFTLEYLKEYNPYPVRHVTNERLGNDESAEKVVREMFL